VVKSGDTTTIDSVCSVAGRNATSHAVVTGSFDSAYTMTVASKSDVGPGINMTIAAKWLGPCQADQKPGDLILPGGIKMNLRDMANRIGVPGIPGRRRGSTDRDGVIPGRAPARTRKGKR
jgi:hypothetical protein